jgi:cytochrome c2
VWTPEALDAFLSEPEAFMPGTAMGLMRMRAPAERAAVIDYLQRHTP